MFSNLLLPLGLALSTVATAYPTFEGLFSRTVPTSGSTCSWILGPEPIARTDLIFGQKDLGSDVTLSLSDGKLIVTYQSVPNYKYDEAHVYLSSTAPPSSHAPGSFPYNTENGSCEFINSHEAVKCTIPYSALNVGEVKDVCCNLEKVFYIATHASIVPDSESPGVSGETGWGQGPCIYSSCNPWAMYWMWTFKIPCKAPPTDPEDPPAKKCRGSGETAYGYNEKAKGTTKGAWAFFHETTATQLASGIGGVMYAGAAKNDISKGFKVGTWSVSIDKATSTLEVKYIMGEGYELAETHFDIRTSFDGRRVEPGQSFDLHEFPNLEGQTVTGVTSDVYKISTVGDAKDKEGALIREYLSANKEFYVTLHAAVYEVVDCPAETVIAN